MENTKTRMTVLDCLKEAGKAIGNFVRTLPKYEDDNEIEDIDNLSSFSDDDRATIEEIKRVEANLKKAASSKKNLSNQVKVNEKEYEKAKQNKIFESKNSIKDKVAQIEYDNLNKIK